MFLTSEQTGGPQVFALRNGNRYLTVDRFHVEIFDIRRLAQALGQDAGETWQGHAQVILLACCDGRLFEWLDRIKGGPNEQVSENPNCVSA